MKKIILILLAIFMLIIPSQAVTLKLIQPEGTVTMTRPAGNEITLKDVTNQIRWWEVKSGGIQIIDNKFVMPNNNVEVEAKYTGNVINVIQGANGTIAPAGPAVPVTQGGSQKFTMTPNIGYQVSNVVVDGSGQGAITEYTFSNIQANHKITATYIPVDYGIGYTLNGGTVSPANPETYNIETPTFTLNNPTREGYRFAGWSGTGITGTSTSVSIPKGSYGARSYTANWTANTYTVVYNGNGATSGSTASSSHTYDQAKALTANGFSKTGYKFLGWDTSSNGTTVVYTNSQSVTNLTTTNGGTVNLYAVWEACTYNVVYHGNGATSGSTATSTHYIDVAKNLTANGYVKTNYKFIGWDTAEAGTTVVYTNSQSVINLTTAGGTVNLYAVWEINVFTVVYHGNGATSGSTATSTHTMDVAQNLTANGYYKTECKFIGWDTAEAGTTVVYTDSQSVTNLTTAGGTVNLYAVWQINIFTIKFEANGGTGTMADAKYAYDYMVEINAGNLTLGQVVLSYYKLPTNQFSKPYNYFIGWDTSSDATTVVYKDKNPLTTDFRESLSPGDVVTLYAVWDPMTTDDIAIDSYVKYEPIGTVTALASDTGYSTNQIFDPSGYSDGWIVYSNSDDQLQLISAESIGTLYLGSDYVSYYTENSTALTGKTAYAKAVYTLNKLGSDFATGKYAISGTCYGIEGTPDVFDYQGITSSQLNYSYMNSVATQNGWSNGYIYTEPWGEALGSSYDRVKKKYLSTDYYIWTPGRSFWWSIDSEYPQYHLYLGTSGIDEEGYQRYSIKKVYAGFEMGQGQSFSQSAGFKPVITFNKCRIIGGSGTFEDPYILAGLNECKICHHDAHSGVCGVEDLITYTCTEGSRTPYSCGTCGGDGKTDNVCTSWSYCSTCGGDGIIGASCSTCGGDGKVNSPCGTCGGDGKMTCTGSFVTPSGGCANCGGACATTKRCSTCGASYGFCYKLNSGVGANFGSSSHNEISCNNSSCSSGYILNSATCSSCNGTGSIGSTCTNCSSGRISCTHGNTSNHTLSYNTVTCGTCSGSGVSYSYTYCSLHPGYWDDHEATMTGVCECTSN